MPTSRFKIQVSAGGELKWADADKVFAHLMERYMKTIPNGDKPPTEKQIDMLHDLAGDLKIEVAGVENMNRKNVSKMIDDFKERLSSKRAEEKQQLIKE